MDSLKKVVLGLAIQVVGVDTAIQIINDSMKLFVDNFQLRQFMHAQAIERI